MSTTSEQQEIVQLRQLLHRYNYSYYVLANPEISDYEFDQQLRHLQELEQRHPELFDPNSPTQRVGSDLAANGFRQQRHERPMLSLANTYSFAEVEDFYHRVEKGLQGDFEIVCELKFDGTSISLIYEDGALQSAVTRGDGNMGDVVTDNIRTVNTVPLQLQGDFPSRLEMRGEVLLPWQEFNRLNNERCANLETPFANPRNAAAGTLKLLDSKEVARRKLDVILYYLLTDEQVCDTHYDSLQKAHTWGFQISEHTQVCHSLQEVLDFIATWDEKRHTLPVATDGMVLKVNNLQQQKRLGSTAKCPRWAIAYKFQPEQAHSRLLSVSFQVGRTGVVTPVANLEPVQLSGTVVRRATLHNADFISQLGLFEGDVVSVEKGGEIIPKITGVVMSERQAMAQPIIYPKTCPECGAVLERIDDEAATICPNRLCPPQIKGRIEHFVSRKAMNIDGLGTETIATLYDLGLIRDIADLYDLKPMQLTTIEGLGEKSVNNLMASIVESRKVPFERVLFALGIPGCGEQVAKILARQFKNIDAIANASMEQLTHINDIGVVLAQNIINYFDDIENIRLLERLRSHGLTMETTTSQEPTSDILAGKSVVVSGVFSQHSRDEYKAIIEQNGGKVVSSVSKQTSMILAGENMGPSKREKAEALGVRIVNEDEFLAMIK
ncbi:MAG: NAD-dependent DNA ligase LigA [Bacteroidales bacterium]|nr:NAD-dependent DNA ligase LigA [Bacteroidales bacterium]